MPEAPADMADLSDARYALVRGAVLGLFVNPKHIRFCGGSQFVSPPQTGQCLPHTPHPEGYIAHGEWADRMMTTHDQKRCPGCGLWAIWTAKETDQP